MRVPKVTVEQIVRPALAFVFIVAYGLTGPHVTAASASTTFNHYETECQIAARQEFDVPAYTLDTSAGLVGWQREHLGTPESNAYNAAFAACPSPEKFDFSNMVLVNSEQLP